ncbi:EamA family transporter [Oricola sp.]|uniref:EamA family transporter n=1 Tax=Oricola sp. TaxID=1979950 RepID=UPI003BA8448F
MRQDVDPKQQPTLNRLTANVPPYAWFCVSAVFHYLGPSLAVLLFPAAGVLGIAWFRIASAALVFAPLTKPWRTLGQAEPATRGLLLSLGACLAAMNTAFYLALDKLPMSLVAAMEFTATLLVALYGLRTPRNLFAVGLAIAGVWLLIDVRWATSPVGLFWSAINAALFAVYIILGHRVSQTGADAGIKRLGAAMFIAFVFVTPVGAAQAVTIFANPLLVLAGIGVGICSSVIPYVCDQLAMSRIPRASFALMLALLPAFATVIAAIVLAQIPTSRDLAGVALVMAGIAMHRPR